MFLSPDSAFNYVILMLHIRLLCANKNFLLTYLLISRNVREKSFQTAFVQLNIQQQPIYSAIQNNDVLITSVFTDV